MKREQGQLIPRGPRTWLLRVSQGRDQDGKRQFFSETVTGSKRDAERQLNELLHKKDRGELKKPEARQTLREYLQNWLSRKLSISERTLHDYRVRLETDVIPELGFLKLGDITTSKIEDLYARLASRHKPATIRYTHVVLKAALQTAVDRGLLLKNPAAAKIERPKVTPRPFTVLSPEQIQIVFDKAKTDPLYPLWCLMLGGGFRPGEALALKWRDLVQDADGAWVVIQRTLKGDGRGNYEIVENSGKTEGSLRRTLLSPTVVALLNRHRTQQVEASLLSGVRSDFVFRSKTGSWLEPAAVRKRWKSLLKGLGLPNVRFYDTRASHATSLLAKGIGIEFISNRLGHKSITTTQRYYARFLPTSQQAAANAFDALVGGSR